MKNSGFTLVEILVTTVLTVIVITTGFLFFVSGKQLWALVNEQILLQENARQGLQRISFELQESGRDLNDNLQVSITDDTGPNLSDILRFSIPLCPCGQSVMDADGEVHHWGAPFVWGQTGCSDDYPLNAQGKVDICHVPPGNPGTHISLSVAESSVKAHLGHGDWLGDCSACDPTAYNNRMIEYKIDNDGHLLRNILDSSSNILASETIAENVTNFQAVLSAGQDLVTLTLSLTGPNQNMGVTFVKSESVLLRNYD